MINEIHLEHSQLILNNAPIGLVILNNQDEIEVWNQKLVDLTGFHFSDVNHKNLYQLFNILKTNNSLYHFSFITKDASILNFKAETKWLESENRTVVAIQDITEQVQKEKDSERLLNQMVILNDLSRTISTELDFNAFIETFCQQLQWIYAPTLTRFFVKNIANPNSFKLVKHKSNADYTYNADNTLLTKENSPLEEIIEGQSSKNFFTKSEHEQFSDSEDFETLTYYPIIQNNEVSAIISISDLKPHFLDDITITSLELLSDIAAISLQNVKFYSDINKKNTQMEIVIQDLQEAKEAIEQQAGYLSQLLEETEQARTIIEKQNKNKKRELDKAAELQQSLLPEKMFESEHCAFESIYIPCNEVAGDIYDVILREDGHIGILIADVSDHGVSSAMIAAMFKMVFSIYSKEHYSPAKVFEEVNRILIDNIVSDDFVTAFYGIYNPENGDFVYASAGHPEALVCDSTGNSIQKLETDGFFIGMFDFTKFEEKKTTLKSGDHLFMYTDGIYEIKNPSEEEYGKEKLFESFIDSIQDMNMFPLATLLVTAEMFSEGIPYDDDITLIHTIIK